MSDRNASMWLLARLRDGGGKLEQTMPPMAGAEAVVSVEKICALCSGCAILGRDLCFIQPHRHWLGAPPYQDETMAIWSRNPDACTLAPR